MREPKLRSIVTFLLLCVAVTCSLTAGGASPLATQSAAIGPYVVLLSFYSLPRAGQSMNMTIESGRPAEPLQFSNAVLHPAPGTDGNSIPAALTPNGESQHVFNVQVTPPVKGKWLLHLQLTGAAGAASGDIPINVDGPPAIPLWLGWLIGLVPLPFLLLFIAYQIIWRKKQLAHA